MYQYRLIQKSDQWQAYTPLHADIKNDWKNYQLSGIYQYKLVAATMLRCIRLTTCIPTTLKIQLNAAGTYKNYDSGDPNSTSTVATVQVFPRMTYQIQTGVSKVTSVAEATFEDNAAPLTEQTTIDYDLSTFYKKHQATTQSDGRTKENYLQVYQ